MEDTNPNILDTIHKGNNDIASIIGIGEKAKVIVDKIQPNQFPATQFWAISMNQEELEKVSYSDKQLPTPESLAKHNLAIDKQKREDDIRNILNRFLTCFIVDCKDDSCEECIKTLLETSDISPKIKILIVILPTIQEGPEEQHITSRLQRLEKLVDGVFLVDSHSFSYPSTSEALDKFDTRAIQSIKALLKPVIERNMLNFGYNDVATFMQRNSNTKNIDYLSLSGDINNLEHETKDLHQHLPYGYSSMKDVQSLLLLVTYNHLTDEDTFQLFLKNIVLNIMQSLDNEAFVKWGVFDDPEMGKDIFRIDILAKRY